MFLIFPFYDRIELNARYSLLCNNNTNNTQK